mgnify:CR=1 FL=1
MVTTIKCLTINQQVLCIINWDYFDLWDYLGLNTLARKAVKREGFLLRVTSWGLRVLSK